MAKKEKQTELDGWCGASFSFFSNTSCEYFPCHETDDPENFNCLFCFCPLYAYGEGCGGTGCFTESGIRDCSSCSFPHGRNSYGAVTRRLATLQGRQRQELLDIAVIRFPSFANRCDFSALEAEPRAVVRFVTKSTALGAPDLVIIPGSTNTLADMLWMRMGGLEKAVLSLANDNKPIIGICGGYQILGERIDDEDGVENGGQIAGMGLLPIKTVFAKNGRETRMRAHILTLDGTLAPLSGLPISGYEMHHGHSQRAAGSAPLCLLEDGTEDGCINGNIYGTYLHGFFDEPACRTALLDALVEARLA